MADWLSPIFMCILVLRPYVNSPEFGYQYGYNILTLRDLFVGSKYIPYTHYKKEYVLVNLIRIDTFYTFIVLNN